MRLTVSASGSMAIALILGLGLGFLWAIEVPGRGAARISDSIVTQKLVVAPAFEDAALARSSQGHCEEADSSTLAHCLSDYWGPQWPLVQEKLESRGIDASMPFLFRPWSDVAADLRNECVVLSAAEQESLLVDYLSWPEELTLDWLRKSYRVPSTFSEGDLYAVEDAVSDYNLRIHALALDYFLAIGEALAIEWDSGRFVRVPFASDLVPGQPMTESGFFSRSLAGKGWAISLSISPDEYPSIVKLTETLEACVKERDDRVQSVIDGS